MRREMVLPATQALPLAHCNVLQPCTGPVTAAQCSAVQCSAVQCSTVQHSAAQHSAAQCTAEHERHAAAGWACYAIEVLHNHSYDRGYMRRASAHCPASHCGQLPLVAPVSREGWIGWVGGIWWQQRSIRAQ